MKFLAAITLLASQTCNHIPTEPIKPIGTGGFSGTGGSISTGGTLSTGGSQVVIKWPECSNQVRKSQSSDIERYRKLLRKPYPIPKGIRTNNVVIENLPDVFWLPLAPTLNQRRGSCTANAVLQGRISQPWTWNGSFNPEILQDLADAIYSGATKRDPFPGEWPPTDSGSNGLSALAEARDRGIVGGWISVTSFDELQKQLQLGPCIMGTNWYTSMFTPDRCGELSISGIIEGGHEWTIKGMHNNTKRILALNSWGDDFGAKLYSQGGFFWLSFSNVQRLLNEGGEIECITK